MRFRSFDNLSVFNVVARHMSFTSAAQELNLTKGAISYRIKRLEEELSFTLFIRRHGGIELTDKGNRLWRSSQANLNSLEQEINELREVGTDRITIGMSTYFASRWLSSRLMMFITNHPNIGLRLQPTIDLYDLRSENIDMAIRWGKGDWADLQIELLFHCPAIPTAGIAIGESIKRAGMEAMLPDLTLLHDHEHSEAWRDWHEAAGLPYQSRRDDLVIPDPNVRVQALINGQGAALNDALVADELASGELVRISNLELSNYGYYLAYPDDALSKPPLRAFRDWIVEEAELFSRV